MLCFVIAFKKVMCVVANFINSREIHIFTVTHLNASFVPLAGFQRIHMNVLLSQNMLKLIKINKNFI